MDALHQQIRNIDFSNWLDVAVAISVTTKGISEYLESTILALHQEIKNGACALLPNCKQNCSKTLRNFSTWCPTCVKWKGQIKSYNKYRNRERKIKWGDINSSDWPRNVDEMVKVFAPEWWRARTPYTEDLSVALHVIQNCTKFNIPVLICQRVRDVRNALFAHGHLQVDNAEKKNAFRILLTILKLPEISQTRSGRLAISQLKRLKSKCVIDLMTEDEAFRHHLVLALNPYKDTDREILNQYEHVKELRLCLREDQNGQLQRILTERTRIVGRVYGNGRFAIALIISFICIIIILLNIGHRDDTTWEGLHNEKGCLPMTFSSPCPWKPDFTFDGYLTNRPILIGRNWLIDKIQTSLFGTSSRGILLTAEMGYGKSTLVSHVLCTGELTERKLLHSYILSYHICKFDVISTQKPDYFIKNLAGMLISKLPEAGNAILTDELAMTFLETSKCAEDPVGCIDASIIHPLRGLTFDEERYVVIDAIDECGDSAAIGMSILDVLSKRIGKMPWWLKFFITTRNIYAVTSKLSEMEILHEVPGNVQNQYDIAAYLDNNLFLNRPVLSRLFGTHADKKVVTEHILKISGSNFLYVDLAVKFWIDSPHSKVTDIPQSLGELYAYNLDRVFGAKEHVYDVARNVFEVLCTSYKRLQLEELEAILNVTNHPYDLRDLLRNQISHFVEYKTYISIYHKAICDYLTSNSSGYHKYHISTHNGHKLFANFFLSKYNNSMNDVLSLFIHVAESSNSDLLYSFQHSKYFLKENMSSIRHLHLMAKTKNSFQGTKLLIRAIGIQHINSLTSANVTATFLAAAFGNSETLKALIDEGGDYLFRTQNPPNKGGWEDAIAFCKYKSLWGYGLLDIAAQNGHVEVVNVLLAKNISLLYFKNGLGLNAVHLAAEHSHTDILQKFLEIKSSLADQYSLYLASKNGHLRSVLLLLNHGVEDVCVKCEDSIHWIANNTKRMQWHPCSNITDSYDCDPILIGKYNELDNVTFVLNDDTRLIECLTALEVAVQGGYTEIVSYLLSQKTNALHCREYGGRTPVLTAVRYNRSEILDLIVDKGGSFTDKCEHLYNVTNRHSLRLFNINEKTALDNGMCPLGATIEHIIAMNGRKEIAEHLRSQGISLNWTVQDESGNTPLHYAACNNEWKMIQYIISVEDSYVYLTSKNGSLPIHSAVLCNAFMSYAVLHPYYLKMLKTIKKLVDSAGKGLFHYRVLGVEYNKDVRDTIDLLTTDEYRLNTAVKDNNLNTFLHVAAEIGNHRIIIPLCLRSNTSLLLEVNNMNQNVIDIAFDNLPHHQEDTLCFNCSVRDLFTKQQNVMYDGVLSKEETVIYRIFQILREKISDIQRSVDFRRYYRLAVMKGNTFILYSIIMFQPRPLVVPVDKQLLRAFFSVEKPAKGMLSLLSQFTSDFCNKTFEESLVHRVIRNENNRYWIYFKLCEAFEVLNTRLISFWETCYDRDGYNVLHHAVMGGNYVAVKFLIESGITVRGLSSSKAIDLISLGVSHADIYVIDHLKARPFMTYKVSYIENGKLSFIKHYNEDSFYRLTKNFDETSSYILSSILKWNKLRFAHFCKRKSKQLSLVHRAAIKGHLSLLMTMYKVFGRRVLQCANVHLFTPLYFAKVFDHSDVVNFLGRKLVANLLPYKMAELVFLQVFAADDVSVPTNVPAHVHIITKLTHPYLYHMNPVYKLFVRRTFARLCFDVVKTLPELGSVLQKSTFNSADIHDTLSPFSNHTLKMLNITRDTPINEEPDLSENMQILVNATMKKSADLAWACPQIVWALRYEDFCVWQRKKINFCILSEIHSSLTNIHKLYTWFQFSVINSRSLSYFHTDRILQLYNHYMVDMSFQTIKEFYAFRRKSLTDMESDIFPRYSNVSTTHFRSLAYSINELLLSKQKLVMIKKLTAFNPRIKFWHKIDKLPFPLYE